MCLEYAYNIATLRKNSSVVVAADSAEPRLLVQLDALRGHDPTDQASSTDSSPNSHGNQCRRRHRLCLSGSHALVYSPKAVGFRVHKAKYADDRLKFYSDNRT